MLTRDKKMEVSTDILSMYRTVQARLHSLRAGTLALAATPVYCAVIENSDKTLQVFRFRILGF